jgi:hypothetical protein
MREDRFFKLAAIVGVTVIALQITVLIFQAIAFLFY